MKIFRTDKRLEAGQEFVVYAPDANAGDEAKVIRNKSLDPYLIAVCVGRIDKLHTPSRHGLSKDAHRGYRRFVVKP